MQKHTVRLFIDPTSTDAYVRFTAQQTADCSQPELMSVTVEPVIDHSISPPHLTPHIFRLQGIRVESDRNAFARFTGLFDAHRGRGIGYFVAPNADKLAAPATI